MGKNSKSESISQKILNLTHTERQRQWQRSYNAGLGNEWRLGMGVGPIFKRYHRQALYDADAATVQ